LIMTDRQDSVASQSDRAQPIKILVFSDIAGYYRQ
jgi:hypothetical protein